MLLAACGRMAPGRIRSARVEERSSVRLFGKQRNSLSRYRRLSRLLVPSAMLSFAVREKEKEGGIACCLSSVRVRVGFDMFGSVIGGRIESSHRIFHVSAWLAHGCCWRDLALSSPLSNIYLAYILLVSSICEIQNSSTSHNTQTPEGSSKILYVATVGPRCCRSTAVLFYQITHTSTPN